MNKSDKEKIVAQLNEKFSDTKLVCLTNFKGLNVPEISSLRHELRRANTEYSVIKNTLAKRALKGTVLEPLEEHFHGPIAIALSSDDPAEPAKILCKFSKENPNLEIKTGFLDGKPLTRESIEALSKLPPREILLATLFGTLKAPSSGLVNVLAGIMRKFLGVLHAIESQKQNQENS